MNHLCSFHLQAHAQRAMEKGGADIKDLEKATAPPPLPADEADVSVCTFAFVRAQLVATCLC